MDLSQLRIFLAVIDTGCVTAAGEQIGITAGAVSQQLRGLAVQPGTELFARSGRRIAPTPRGLRLAEHARGILLQVRAAAAS